MKQSEGLGEDMHKSNMCGSCHVGEPAFAIGIQTCSRCHVSEIGASDDKKKKREKKKREKKKKEGKEGTD